MAFTVTPFFDLRTASEWVNETIAPNGEASPACFNKPSFRSPKATSGTVTTPQPEEVKPPEKRRYCLCVCLAHEYLGICGEVGKMQPPKEKTQAGSSLPLAEIASKVCL
jgi:hypothetical protein